MSIMNVFYVIGEKTNMIEDGTISFLNQGNVIENDLLPTEEEYPNHTSEQQLSNETPSPVISEEIGVDDNTTNIAAGNQSVGSSSQPKANPSDWMNEMLKVGAILWISIVILFTMYTIAINIAFAINVKKKYTIVRNERILLILEDCKKMMNINRNITLLTTNQMRTPSLYVMFQVKILVSESYMQKLSDNEVKYIFLHELSHYKRKDVIVNWLATLLQIIYFFHPLLWYAFHKMYEDCEVSCDAAALRYIREEEYQSYGSTIIKLIKLFSESNFIPITSGIGKSKSSYKRRIVMISKYQRGKWSNTVLAILLIAMVGVAGLTGCNLVGKDKKDNSTQETNQSDLLENKEPENDIKEQENDLIDQENTLNEQENPLTDKEEDGGVSPEEGISYFGDWMIDKVQAFGVGTYSGEDAESLVGKTLTFQSDRASIFGDQLADVGQSVTNPNYSEVEMTEDEFVADYHISFSNLGIDQKIATVVTVSDENGAISTFIVKDDQRLIIVGGGTYFALSRISGNGPEGQLIYEQQQILANIQSIDTERQTLTIDRVELLYEDDVERLKEVGMENEDLTTGYVLYNEEVKYEEISYPGILSIEMFNDPSSATLSETSIENLAELLEQKHVLSNITLDGNNAIKITEQYLP